MHIKIIQNHFTIRFQMKSAADLRVFLKVLSYRMPEWLKAVSNIRGLYDIDFNIMDDKTLLLSGHFENDFDELIYKLAKSAGTVFDALFRHVQNPSSMPVSGNAADFVLWISQHRVTLPFQVTGNLN